MQNGNGKIWKITVGVLAGVVISLIAIIYGGLVETNKVTANDLKDHKEYQIETDKQTATAMTSINNRLCNIEQALKINKGKCE